MALHGLPRATVTGTLRRASRVALATARMGARLLGDRLRGRLTHRRIGQRLREAIEELGATATKIGQQLSVRADLLPPEVTFELERLTDRMPPVPWEQVPGLIAAELGRPIEEVFSHVDPAPIGSASLACVYRGRLLDGREVAIKVQRPGVAMRFAEDLAVLDLMTWSMEAFTLVPAKMFHNLRFDMKLMFGEELDFRLEARYQRTFRRITRQAGMKWITAPRVVSALSTRRLIVTEFVRGVSGGAVLAAIESGDTAALLGWGLDPKRLASRLGRFSAWARMQATMMHVDPHPGNLILLPDDQIVLIDFGACSPAAPRSHRNHREVVRLALAEDHSAIARVMLNDVSPLPLLDMDSLLREMEASFSRYIRALRTPGAHWSERITAGIWMEMLEVTRRYKIQLNLDTIRAIRAFMLYDTVVYRLNPESGTGELQKVVDDLRARDGRALRGQLTGLLDSDQREVRLGELAQVLERLRAVLFRLEPTLMSLQMLLQTMLKQRDAFLRQVARGVATFGLVLALVNGVATLRWLGMDLPTLTPTALRALGALAGLALVGVLAIAGRRLLIDLDRVNA